MPAKRRRLDAELVRRGLASGRDHAKRLIAEGSVEVSGASAPKAATLVGPDAEITLASGEPAWASRGGIKLDAALSRFDIDPEKRHVLDVGASTGGFTDVLLARGAASVVAVDVGYGQLVWRLSQDERVTVVDRTNFRTVDVGDLGAPFDLIVADVSFISLTLLAPQLAAAGRPGTGYVVLVKPQFEVGKHRVKRGGIVHAPEDHVDAIERVAAAFDAEGIGTTDLMRSPITGTKGNVEFLLGARLDEPRRLEPATIAATVHP
jgi:23S rRNA (cytidine1920-2'-O)/16S rRNA (cytidine1409-2'-O)-methyltransferase